MYPTRHDPLRWLILMLISPFVITAADAQALSWTRTSLQTEDHVTAVVVKGSSIVAGTAGKGIFHSSDGGATWSPATPALTGIEVRALGIDGNGAMIAGTGAGALRSTDDGATWTDMNKGLSTIGRSIEAFDQLQGFVLAATDDGVYAFSTTQQEWAPIGLQGTQVMTVAFDGAGGIVASAFPDQLYHMTQSSPGSWIPSATRVTGVLAMTSTGDGKLFAASSSLYVSSDLGASWQPTSYSSTLIFTIIRNDPNGLLIGDYDGVTLTTDGGSSWTPLRGTNAPTQVMSVAVGEDGRIYAGTFGGDLYISSGNPSSVDADAVTPGIAGLTLGGAYPNPARDRVTIPFTLPRRADARITLSDPLGRLVAGKDAGTLDAGAHEIALDLSSCPSGLYLCTLSADGVSRTRVVTVVR